MTLNEYEDFIGHTDLEVVDILKRMHYITKNYDCPIRRGIRQDLEGLIGKLVVCSSDYR